MIGQFLVYTAPSMPCYSEDRKVYMAKNRVLLFSLEFNTKVDEPELYVIRVSRRTTQSDDTTKLRGGGYGPDCEKAELRH